MIARLWRGRVPVARAEEYLEYQREVGPPNYRAVPGNLGVFLLGRELGAEYEVSMLTIWDSWDAIRAFAGDPVDRARYYERDFDYLIDPPEKVEHFEVLEAEPERALGVERLESEDPKLRYVDAHPHRLHLGPAVYLEAGDVRLCAEESRLAGRGAGWGRPSPPVRVGEEFGYRAGGEGEGGDPINPTAPSASRRRSPS